MKIGVAIPAYIGHVDKLIELLVSIEKQTRLPDKVVVSCSSTTQFINNKKFSFPLEILLISEKKNAAQNRNIAISRLSDMDYVTFIDADDIMHPQRIEILLDVFQNFDVDIILHSFILNGDDAFELLEKVNVRVNSLMICHTGCIRHIDYFQYNNEHIHHGHVTVKRNILDKVQFPEEDEFLTKEDCVFCRRVFELENIKNGYIADKLSKYKQSHTGGYS